MAPSPCRGGGAGLGLRTTVIERRRATTILLMAPGEARAIVFAKAYRMGRRRRGCKGRAVDNRRRVGAIPPAGAVVSKACERIRTSESDVPRSAGSDQRSR